jgi:hypothetical protein
MDKRENVMTARPGWKPTGLPPVPLPIDLPAHPRLSRDHPARKGLPETQPYTYHGTGEDDEPGPPVIVFRRRSPRHPEWDGQIHPAWRLDVCEAIDGPGPEWYADRDQP